MIVFILQKLDHVIYIIHTYKFHQNTCALIIIYLEFVKTFVSGIVYRSGLKDWVKSQVQVRMREVKRWEKSMTEGPVSQEV